MPTTRLNRTPGQPRLSRLYQLRWSPLWKRGRPRVCAYEQAQATVFDEAQMLRLLDTARDLLAPQ